MVAEGRGELVNRKAYRAVDRISDGCDFDGGAAEADPEEEEPPRFLPISGLKGAYTGGRFGMPAGRKRGLVRSRSQRAPMGLVGETGATPPACGDIRGRGFKSCMAMAPPPIKSSKP